MATSTEQRLQRMLQLLQHSPMAMVEIDPTGAMLQVNPKAVQLMMPLAMHLGLPGDNLLDMLTGFIPSVSQLINNFEANSGLIIDYEPYILRFMDAQTLYERQFSLTVAKESSESLFIFFEDVTDFLIKVNDRRQES